MRSRTTYKRRMKTTQKDPAGTKTLNVRQDVHKKVKRAALEADVPIGVYVEAVIEVGLSRPREVTKRLSEAGTNQAKPEPEKP